MARLFLLSPAYCGGRRAALLLRPESEFALARQLRSGDLSLGAAFSFMSGLYFRGKLTYAAMFGTRSAELPEATFIITPTRGLQSPAMRVSADVIREFAEVDVDAADDRYRAALERDARALAARLPDPCEVVLLGSVATGKYVDVLAPLLSGRLRYPSAFVGRGDMSRGGLLLRSAAAGEELDYEMLHMGVRPTGVRPPKLAAGGRATGGGDRAKGGRRGEGS